MLILSYLDEWTRFSFCALVSKVWRLAALQKDIPHLDLSPSGYFGYKFARHMDKVRLGRDLTRPYLENFRLLQKEVGAFFKAAPMKIRAGAVLSLKIDTIDLASLSALFAFMPRLTSVQCEAIVDAGNGLFLDEATEEERWRYCQSHKALKKLSTGYYDPSTFRFNLSILESLDIFVNKPVYMSDLIPFHNLLALRELRVNYITGNRYHFCNKFHQKKIDFSKLHNLEVLSIRCMISDAIEVLNEIPSKKLFHLELDYEHEIFTIIPPSLPNLSLFPNLKILKVSGTGTIPFTRELEGKVLEELAIELSPRKVFEILLGAGLPKSLTRLSLGSVDGRFDEIQFLVKFMHLHEIALAIGYYDAARLGPMLKKMPRLEKVAVRALPGYVFGFNPVERGDFEWGSFDGADKFLSCLPKHLKELRLTNFPFSDKVINKLLSLSDLEVVKIEVARLCRFLGEWILEFSRLPKLKDLLFAQNEPRRPNGYERDRPEAMQAITAEDIGYLVDNCPEIRSITVTAGVVGLSRSQGYALHLLLPLFYLLLSPPPFPPPLSFSPLLLCRYETYATAFRSFSDLLAGFLHRRRGVNFDLIQTWDGKN